MGIFWSHEFTPKKGCFFVIHRTVGTEWDFKHFNFNRDTLPRHFWRFSELPKVGLPNDEWIGRQDSVIATSGSTGGSSLRGLAAERDRLQRQAPEWRCVVFFFPPPKKDLSWWFFWRMWHCHVTMFLFLIFFLFSGFWFCILGPGNLARREQPEVQEMRTDVSNARQEGFWKGNSYEKITEVEIFDVLEPKGKISPNFHWVVSKTANRLHLRQVITRRQTSIWFLWWLSWTTSNTPKPEFAWHPQNSLCFNGSSPSLVAAQGRSIRRRSHISWTIMLVCIQDLSTQHQRQKVQTDELHLARKL